MSYDIRIAVRKALAAGYSADPTIIADKVAAAVPAKELRAALTEILPGYVSTVLGLQRAAILAPHDTRPGSNRSAKWEGVGRMLAPMRAADSWQFFKDCTRDDVLAMVATRRNRAASITVMADKLETLAELMAKRKVRVVSDLSEADLEVVFG